MKIKTFDKKYIVTMHFYKAVVLNTGHKSKCVAQYTKNKNILSSISNSAFH